MLKEKQYIIHKINILLNSMDADTVLAFYSVANRLNKKGGFPYDNRRQKAENYSDHTEY